MRNSVSIKIIKKILPKVKQVLFMIQYALKTKFYVNLGLTEKN